MSRTSIILDIVRKLADFRKRALTYAEYLNFSRFLQTEDPILILSKEEWETEVREIELELMRQENPSLMRYNVTDYKPLGIFFDEAYHNVTGIERVD